MSRLGIIGGSGLASLKALKIDRREMVHTPYGEPSGPYSFGTFDGIEVVFLPRHGAGHAISPHCVNYRANIWGMKEIGVDRIIAMAAVGGISETMAPGTLCIPDQIIDYTYSRKQTFFDDDNAPVTHIDFTYPYCDELREVLINAGEKAGISVLPSGTYGATQGPRLETAAEIQRMLQDGCDMVGMTGMPEAALAREAGICYATCAVSVNWAAGRNGSVITMDEIEEYLHSGMIDARKLLAAIEVD